MITGFTKYNNIDHSFVFDENINELQLIPVGNHYAHGDIDKAFIDESLLDVIFLEYLVYAIQLKSFGVSDENNRKAINDLFHLNYAL